MGRETTRSAPAEGLTLEQLFAGRGINIEEMLDHLHRTARTLDLPFGERRKTFNSRNAQELGKWAESRGKGDAFHNAVFRAYFAEGKNIARPCLYASINSFFDSDWQRSYQLGIRAVPTFVLNGRFLTGAQNYQALAAFVRAHR